MAVDQTLIVLDITSRVVDLTTRFLGVLHELEEEVKHANEAGINFNNYDADFAASPELQHIDGSLINKVENDIIGGAASIRNFLATTNSGAKSYEKILYEIRR